MIPLRYDLWAPVLEESGVDLVLNGHDHIYIRSYPMMNNQIAAEGHDLRRGGIVRS